MLRPRPFFLTGAVFRVPDGVMVAHGPLEARVKVRVLVGQPALASGRKEGLGKLQI